MLLSKGLHISTAAACEAYSPSSPGPGPAQIPEGSGAAAGAESNGGGGVVALRRQLEEEVAVEDPYSGEVVARNVRLPFVQPDEAALAESWAV